MDRIISNFELEFEAGILRWWEVRELLESEKWNGTKIEWRESRGWFSRLWQIRGDKETLLRIENLLRAASKDDPKQSPPILGQKSRHYQ